MRLAGADAPLAVRIKRTAFAMTLLIIACLWGVMFALTLREIPATGKETNANAVRVVGEVLAGDIDNELGDLRRLSASSLVWTALTDSTGREAYLKPFLSARERERSGAGGAGGAGLLLLDYKGRSVLGDPSPGADPRQLEVLSAQVLADKRPRVQVIGEGRGARLVVVYPVIFPYTQDAIGALVGTLDLDALFARRTERLGEGFGVELIHDGRTLSRHPATAPSHRYFPVDFPVRIEDEVEGGELSLRLYATHSPWIGPVLQRVLAAAVLSVLLGALVWRLSGIAARRLTRRLQALASACEAASAEGAERIPLDDTPDEIGVLSRALRDALMAYERINARLEELVDEKTRALSVSEERLRGAIDAIDEAFVIFDPDDRLVYCNERYRAVYPSVRDLTQPGTPFEEIVRNWHMRLHPDSGPAEVDRWVAERVETHRNGGILIQHVDGDRWVRIVERRTADGHTVGFRVDITELVRAKELADAANVAKSRFLATMSHELRTPMNGILGMAQLLMSSTLSDDERREYASTILNSGRMLLSLLNDILDFSKIEADKVRLELRPMLPAKLFDELGKLFLEAARFKEITFEHRWLLPAEQWYVLDAVRLRQMLSNLIDNAIKFTPRGAVSLEGREVRREGDEVILEFSVTDTGIGIAPEKQALLFQPFSQADSSTTRQYGGTGLGLSIVRSLAHLMRGEAGLDSTPGRGSRFWIRIRAGLATAPAASGAEGLVRGSTLDAPPARGEGLRFLVVEDNAINRKVIEALLRKMGIESLLAEDGQQGVDRLTGGAKVDLVLMDLQMPVLDGFQATEAIRRWEREAGRMPVPIVALTADVFEETRQKCLSTGMNDFIPKPVSVETLKSVIGKLLGRAG